MPIHLGFRARAGATFETNLRGNLRFSRAERWRTGLLTGVSFLFDLFSIRSNRDMFQLPKRYLLSSLICLLSPIAAAQSLNPSSLSSSKYTATDRNAHHHFEQLIGDAGQLNSVALAAYIKASNSDNQDSFGWSVAASGDTLVVGAYLESGGASGINGDQSDDTATQAGAVYVFVRSGGNWTQQAYIKASNTERLDFFGYSVAIDGDTLLVGATGEDSESTGVNSFQNGVDASASGAVYVFVRSGTTWSQQAYLKASNTENLDAFGYSVAIDGDLIAVGAQSEDGSVAGVNGDQSDNGATSSGAVYMFQRTGTTWTQDAYLKASFPGNADNFGGSVGVSGDRVVVGAGLEDSVTSGINGDANNNSFMQTGAAYVFVRNGITWSQEAYLKASNNGGAMQFGGQRRVAFSGNTIVVGAPHEDGGGTGVNSAQTGSFSSNSGAAYVFVRNGTTWSQQAYLKASTNGGADRFGFTADIDGDTIIVGAYNEDSDATGIDGDETNDNANNSGAAYVFTRNGTTWNHEAYVKASNTGTGDDFGISVAVGGAGTLVFGGANDEDSDAIGIGGDPFNDDGDRNGAVYAYEVDGETFSGDIASLSLSTGGTQVLSLTGGASSANWFYWIFGSVTGTAPGIDFGGGIILPLNFDVYFNITLTTPTLGAFNSFFSALDGSGNATASLTLPAGLDPALAGVTMNHAYLAAEILGVPNFASESVALLLIP
ncbi:MAG: hypothetical protein ACI8TQ_000737 [Planctomycetota bacterium]|jgi:hypothetical protein